VLRGAQVTRGFLFTVLGLAALAAALLSSHGRFLGVGLAVVFPAPRRHRVQQCDSIARSLSTFVKESVRVEVWGVLLPSSGGTGFQIDSVTAFGVGLLIHLRATPGGPRTLLKVAQPGSVRLEEIRIEINEARYVSWAGTKLKPALDNTAPALVLLTRPQSTG
jgi:hypothetical protein